MTTKKLSPVRFAIAVGAVIALVGCTSTASEEPVVGSEKIAPILDALPNRQISTPNLQIPDPDPDPYAVHRNLELALLDPLDPPCTDAGAATFRDVTDPVTGVVTTEVVWPRVMCMTPEEVWDRNNDLTQMWEDSTAPQLDPNVQHCINYLSDPVQTVCMTTDQVQERNGQIAYANARYGDRVTPR